MKAREGQHREEKRAHWVYYVLDLTGRAVRTYPVKRVTPVSPGPYRGVELSWLAQGEGDWDFRKGRVPQKHEGEESNNGLTNSQATERLWRGDMREKKDERGCV